MMNESLNVFEIKTPDVDLDEIRAIIAERITERQRYAQAHGLNFEKLAQPADWLAKRAEAIRWTIALMASRQGDILLSPYTLPPGQPWFTYLMAWLRKQLHNLVIYYVNRLGQKQIAFNESVGWAMAMEHADHEKWQVRVSALEQKVQRLEAQLADRVTETHA